MRIIWESRKSFYLFIVAVIFITGVIAGSFFFSEPRESESVGGILIPPALAQVPGGSGWADIVEKAVPAVVNISSKKVVKTNIRVSPFFSDPFFRQFFGDEFFRRFNVPRERVERSLGSGVIVTSDGYILTNNHLVGKAEEVQVFLPDGREFDAKIVGTDPKSDVAVIKIDAKDLPTLPLGDSSKLRLGDVVLAIGYPFGIGQTVTMGIVSALGRSNLKIVDYEDFIQTDAAINPGNSGGALINTKGELVGINTAILSRSGGYQGIGFAIPINMAQTIMESIIKYGRVIRGWLGVVIQNMTPQMADVFGLESAEGVIISDVQKDSPAEKGGIERGDVVISYNGKKVENITKFREMVAGTKPGTKVEIVVLRDGKEKKLRVKIGEAPSKKKEIASAGEGESGLPEVLKGMEFDDITSYYRKNFDIPDDVEGVVITGVSPGSKGAEAGLREGDVIIEVNRIRVRDMDDFTSALRRVKGNKVLLLVFRNGTHFYVLIR